LIGRDGRKAASLAQNQRCILIEQRGVVLDNTIITAVRHEQVAGAVNRHSHRQAQPTCAGATDSGLEIAILAKYAIGNRVRNQRIVIFKNTIVGHIGDIQPSGGIHC
jgi:hypothetical protein